LFLLPTKIANRKPSNL